MPSDSRESVFNPHTSSHGLAGAELTRLPLSALTSNQNSNPLPAGLKKTALVLATTAVLGLSAVVAPSPAEAHWWGRPFGPGLAGGLIAGAVIGGIASSAYGYGPGYGYPGYGYPGYGYYAGYAPAYYGGYDTYPWGGYTTTYYSGRYAPAYYGPRYRRVFHHRWHHHHW